MMTSCCRYMVACQLHDETVRMGAQEADEPLNTDEASVTDSNKVFPRGQNEELAVLCLMLRQM
jgi:hypothetical protein